MIAFKNILVPIDNTTESIKALEFAALFASGTGAKITALHLMDVADYKTKAEFQKELAILVDEQLSPKLKLIHRSYPEIRKIELQTRALDKSIHRDILEYTKENKVDLLIIRNQQISYNEDWEDRFKKTVAYKIVLETLCPVLTYNTFPAEYKLKNILVPIDLSEGSLYKIPVAAALAKQFDARIHLLSASEHKDDHDDLQKQLIEVKEELQLQGIEVVNANIFNAELPDAIATYNLTNDCDLNIIMSRPGFRWSDLWVSPKAKRIISQSKTPVISIRSDKPIEVDL